MYKRQPKEDIVDIAGFLIGFPGSLGESNSSIQKNFIDYLISLNNAIPKIVNQNNFNNAFIDASAAFVDADLVQDFNKLTEDANQLIGTLKGKEALSDAEQEQIKELLSQIQSLTPSILSYNEKAKTAIELYKLLKNTGVKGDKIISDSIGEIKLAELVAVSYTHLTLPTKA